MCDNLLTERRRRQLFSHRCHHRHHHHHRASQRPHLNTHTYIKPTVSHSLIQSATSAWTLLTDTVGFRSFADRWILKELGEPWPHYMKGCVLQMHYKTASRPTVAAVPYNTTRIVNKRLISIFV